ncbi:MAG: 50S ribosomal protein L13 [Chloroflexota bacterium]
MKTHSTKAVEIKHEWQVVDASEETLGRLASRIAHLLMGKHKPNFVRNLDTGDYVVVLNADKIRVSGKKMSQKIYYHYTGYPGGLKQISLADLMAEHPTRALEHAVRGMLPHTHLGDRMMTKLRVYTGDSHPHEAQLKKAKAEGKEGASEKKA